MNQRLFRTCVLPTIVLSMVLLLLPTQLQAQRFRNPAYDYYLDIPIGWSVLHAEAAEEVSFTDPQRSAIFQVFAFENRFDSIDQLHSYVQLQFQTHGDHSAFTFNNHDSVLADYQFQAGRHNLRGYFVMIHTATRSYVIMAYAPVEHYERYHDTLLSAIDSFAPGSSARRLPGPISQFYYPHPAPQPQEFTLRIDGTELRPAFDEGEIEGAEVLIEREARVLSGYGQGSYTRPDPQDLPQWASAWQRYYRAIYRDNYSRLEPLAEQLAAHFDRTGVSRQQIPHQLLAWLQGFEFFQTESLSRLLSPPATLATRSGDCDSLGLTYVILLHQLGFDAILLVSSEYAHAVAGVNVPGAGWRYPFEGRSYLAAEMTASVDLGLIDSTQADPGGWIPIGFRDPPAR